MEMKEFVWEDLSEEQQDQVVSIARTLGTSIEEILFSFQQFCLAARKLIECLSPLFDAIIEKFDYLIEQRSYEPVEKMKWNVPRKIILKSQVIDRKPKYIRIRNRI